MKNILITGANSYIGNCLEEYFLSFENEYQIQSVDMHGDDWKKKDFSRFDTIIHVAGIVHIKEKDDDLYYRINRDLAFETVKKAKDEGVKQFIYFSSMSVFGLNEGLINANTIPKPVNAYGKSKLEAEERLSELNDDMFIVTILRPPMIYGPNCVGNYQRLSKLAQRIPVFPVVENERSMLYTGNLVAFVKLAIDKRLVGIYHPQNAEFVNTSQLVKEISFVHNRKIHLIKGFRTIINLISKKVGMLQKIFGTLVYDKEIDKTNFLNHQIKTMNYQQTSFKDSILKTEVDAVKKENR